MNEIDSSGVITKQVKDLVDWELDYATSIALGNETLVVAYKNSEGASVYANRGTRQNGIPFRPTKELGRVAEIIERIGGFELKNWLESSPSTKFEAHIHNYEGDFIAFGSDMAQACLRVFVVMKIGDEIDVPDFQSDSQGQNQKA